MGRAVGRGGLSLDNTVCSGRKGSGFSLCDDWYPKSHTCRAKQTHSHPGGVVWVSGEESAISMPRKNQPWGDSTGETVLFRVMPYGTANCANITHRAPRLWRDYTPWLGRRPRVKMTPNAPSSRLHGHFCGKTCFPESFEANGNLAQPAQDGFSSLSRISFRNRAAVAPSTMRWSELRVIFMIFRTVGSPLRTTIESAMLPTARMAA